MEINTMNDVLYNIEEGENYFDLYSVWLLNMKKRSSHDCLMVCITQRYAAILLPVEHRIISSRFKLAISYANNRFPAMRGGQSLRLDIAEAVEKLRPKTVSDVCF